MGNTTSNVHERPLNILVISLHSSRNAGDHALTLVTMQQLNAVFPGARITLATNDPTSYSGDEQTVGSFFVWFKGLGQNLRSRWRWLAMPGLVLDSILAVITFRLLGRPVFVATSRYRQALLRAYLEADLVISCAGNVLYTSGRLGLSFLISTFAMAYAWMAGKPLYMMPQTIGPLERGWERALTRWIVSKMRVILVREPISYRELKAIGVSHPRCYQVPDVAFVFPGAPRQAAVQLLAEHGVDVRRDRPLLGITLLNWAGQNPRFARQVQYETVVADASRAFITRHGGHVVLFSHVWGPTQIEDDRVPARRVAVQLGDLDRRVVLIERLLPPDLLKSVYGLMDIFIGTRMHSNVFALSEGVPSVAIEYRFKTRGIMRMFGLERWVVDIERVDGPGLIEALEAAWMEREPIRETIRQMMPSITEQAGQAGAIIAADFAAWRKAQ
jgi:colanic acid/amylovoran biosynthesis protein